MKIFKNLFPFLVIFVFSFFTFKPLLLGGFFPIHDNTQVARVYDMTKALKDGMFPVRWSQDLGYGFGYPLFNFYDPLPYYVGGTFSILGIDALSSTKILMFLGIILSGLSMFLLSKEYFGKYGGILSSLFYMYAPYHAVDIYIRGDIAEAWAYAMIPFIFYGLLKLSKNLSWKYVSVTALSFGALIASHNLTAMMSTPFILIFVLYLLKNSKIKKQEFIKYSLISILLGVLISAFYWIPAIFEMKFTNVLSQIGGGANFRDNFVCLNQLWASPWGYGGSVKGCIDGLSFMIGKLHILLSIAVFTFALLLVFWKKISKKFNTEVYVLDGIIFFYLCFLISVFLTLNYSLPIWDLLKPMAFIQYPWRFLIFSSFFSSLIVGFITFILAKVVKQNSIFILILTLTFFITAFSYSKFFVPQKQLNLDSSDFTNSYALKWTVSKISDEYMPKNFYKPKSFYEIPDPLNLTTKNLTVNVIKNKTQNVNLDLSIRNAGSFIFPFAYFPSWKAYLDGKQLVVKESQKGIVVNLPKGNHNFTLEFKQTPIELLSDLISLAGILILFTGIIYLRPKHD